MGNNPSKTGGQTPTSPLASHATPSANSQPRKEALVNAQKSSSVPSQPNVPASSPNTPSVTSPPSSRHTRENSRMGNEQSRHRWRDPSDGKSREKTSSAPLKVPRGTDPKRQKGPDTQFESSGPAKDPDYIPRSNLNFPPRLPLPIEEETHTPGSPIITATGSTPELKEEFDVTGLRPGHNSFVSEATTEGDDELHEIQPFPTEGPSKPVQTVIEWKQPGEKVYVTGSFSSWSRKHRMTRNPETNILTATLQLIPGTHHVKFIVDGQMQLSNDLPTAVDITNVLVNYFEVTPTKGASEDGANGLGPRQTLPEQTEAKDHAPDSVGKTQPKDPEKPRRPVFWGDGIPFYLRDGDKPEHTNRFRRAGRTVEDFPDPPSLPVVLSKSILNSATLIKDDSSVLNMPNHTLLNHLATSSIKQEVLATSVTTRYKRKYVTTIMYKPTTET